ncbi:Transcription initiation factor TFIID subunit 12 [Rhizophlyctis rosea]|uniref:Transcription initiation factor TFIID subunit 12 n=1 Tax=Rhizophlyctis rosea TaxID=64517 RepID=A0AAD5S7S4_9FUNG|nr:Transcription initiation factor TFIID subunit 12 [Rhizophlyctis rosea]
MSISALNVPIPVQVDMSTRDLLGEDALKAMVRQIDADIPMEDRRVPKMVADVLDDFVRDITERACKLAKHRKSDTVEIKDAHLALEMNYDIRVPGFGTDDIPDSRRRGGGPLRHVGAHQERTKAVRDALVGPDDGGQRGKGRGKRRPVETRS